jgi:hypothetical protein
MKSCSFRLEQVLRWREMQLNLQRARVGAAGVKVSQSQFLLESRKTEAAASVEQVRREPTGIVLTSYAHNFELSRAGIREAEEQLAAAQRALTVEMDRLLVGNRKLRLLEDLKETGRREWRMEYERELAAFADEAFLGRVLRGTIGKRTGA